MPWPKSEFLLSLPLRFFNIYSLVVLLLAVLLIATGFLGFRQLKGRRDAEASESFFRALIDESPIGMLIFQNLKIEFVNPAMERMSGYTQRELEKMEIWQLIHPESLSGLQAENWFLMKKNSGTQFDFRLTTKTSHEVWVDFSARLIDFYGKPAFIATFYPRTGQIKKSQEPVVSRPDQKSESSIFKNLFEQSNLAMIIYDRETLIIENANAAASSFYGYSLKELNGRPLGLIQVNSETGGYSENNGMVKHKLKGNELREAAVFNNLVEVSGRQLVCSIIIDIADPKSNVLNNDYSIEKSENSSKDNSIFISGISHEIRTPLNSIIGLADLLMQEKNLNEVMAENLRSIKFSSNHLLGIINDVLDFSKLEAGKIHFEKTAFNLEQLVLETAKSVEFRALEKGIPIKVLIHQNVPRTIVSDQGRLRQILLNLLSNAIKFTSEGHIGIYVKLIERTGQNCRIKFTVSDTGIGIPEDKCLSIFESFTQAEVETFKKYGGTGLGLSISKKLVELFGGEIGVKSIESIGSTFWFELPVEISEVNIEPTAEVAPLRLKDLGELKILLVEDDLMNQFVMAQILQKWNAKVEVANNGQVAVNRLTKDTFDLVLLDIHMPEIDGFGVANIIRDRLSGVIDHQVPIIALTADVSSETRAKIKEAGMNDFVSKPSDSEVLYQKVVNFKRSVVKKVHLPSLENGSGIAFAGYDINEMKGVVKVSLREIFDDNPTATASLIGNFLRQIPHILNRVNEYLELEENEQAASVLHRIKPGFHYLGFSSTSAKIEKLQELIRKGMANADLREYILDLKKELNLIIYVLKEILAELELPEPDNSW